MTETIIVIFRSGIALVYGAALSLLFAGAKHKLRREFAIAAFYLIITAIQIICWQILGLELTMKLYPFITNLPTILLISLYFKRPWLISISSVLTAYLCCQIPKWIGSVAKAVFGGHCIEHIAYFLAASLAYYFLKKYVAESTRKIMARSTRSCLLFGAVPLLYYLFDYATTVYTKLLYSGAPEAVQFTPSVICTFYLIFVLLYYNESQKQVEAQRERDIFASQLMQAKTELEKLR